jgi:hypothetical protein
MYKDIFMARQRINRISSFEKYLSILNNTDLSIDKNRKRLKFGID